MNNSSALKRIYFPENMTSLKYIFGAVFINDGNLAELVNFPNSIVSIGESAFKYCEKLKLATLPSSLTYLGSQAFRGCSQLSIEKLPHGLTQILPITFYGCNNVNITHFGNTNGIIAEIDNSLTHIGSEAFANSSTMSAPAEIYLHNSLVYLGSGCFR
jgi:hypothetical protein